MGVFAMQVVIKANDQEFQVEADGQRTILDLALMVGANPVYSCLEGVCETCSMKLLAGEIISFRGEKISTDGARFLACQSLPNSERVVVSF
jgi:ferredoxin